MSAGGSTIKRCIVEPIALQEIIAGLRVAPGVSMRFNYGDLVISYEDWNAILDAALKSLTKENQTK